MPEPGPSAKGGRQQRILDRALEVLAERGPSGTTLRAVPALLDAMLGDAPAGPFPSMLGDA